MTFGVVWMYSMGHVCGNEEAVQRADGGGREEGQARTGGREKGGNEGFPVYSLAFSPKFHKIAHPYPFPHKRKKRKANRFAFLRV